MHLAVGFGFRSWPTFAATAIHFAVSLALAVRMGGKLLEGR